MAVFLGEVQEECSTRRGGINAATTLSDEAYIVPQRTGRGVTGQIHERFFVTFARAQATGACHGIRGKTQQRGVMEFLIDIGEARPPKPQF